MEIKSDKRNEELKDYMRSFEDNPPMVGIFWFLPEDNELFEVHSIPVNQLDLKRKLPYGVTIRVLHEDIWKKNKYKALNHPTSRNRIFIDIKDYTKIPRGRIFYEPDTNTFNVYVGSWYTQYEDTLRELIKEEFNLDEFNFIVSEHWEIGHGWT